MTFWPMTKSGRFVIMSAVKKGTEQPMKASLILICALCACVFVAGCGDKEKEKADLAKVEIIRASLAKQGQILKEHIELLKSTPGAEYGDIMKMQIEADKIKNALAKPADAKDLDKLSALAKATADAAEKLQAEVNKGVDAVRKANEATRKAADAVRRLDADAAK